MDIPLDFSFFNVTDFSDIEGDDPREVGHKTPAKDKDGKFNTRIVRFNNNAIREFKGAIPLFEKILQNPFEITWIDLSFNDLVKIDRSFCDLQKLQILYLQGNQIGDLREIDKLAGLPNLKKLALHGNPIYKITNYRFYVLTKVPQLKNFDMSTITKADRVTASTGTWKTAEMRGKRKKKDAEQ